VVTVGVASKATRCPFTLWEHWFDVFRGQICQN
jgi:hypothetical protein